MFSVPPWFNLQLVFSLSNFAVVAPEKNPPYHFSEKRDYSINAANDHFRQLGPKEIAESRYR